MAADKDMGSDTSDSTSPSPDRKRKRDTTQVSELEVDVSLPEPPSKKALRRAKKQKDTEKRAKASPSEDTAATQVNEPTSPSQGGQKDSAKANRSSYGIWVGNLPFGASKATLRTFFTNAEPQQHDKIQDSDISRIHVPAPTQAKTSGSIKPMNKGFAYIDFGTEEAFNAALELNEIAMGGRRLLIKNAKDFTGRPVKGDDKSSNSKESLKNAHKETKRVFVGNLGFDVTKEDLDQLYSKCGDVEHIHMATFEDSGKCKGFAWITFASVDAAACAVKGFRYLPVDDDEENEELESDTPVNGHGKDDGEGETDLETTGRIASRRKPRRTKWFVNRLHGRQVRCEFAEDSTLRYQKRFGKDAQGRKKGESTVQSDEQADENNINSRAPIEEMGNKPTRKTKNSRKSLDESSINPGAPTDPSRRRGRSNRLPLDHKTHQIGGAIPQSTGTKTTFSS